MILYLTLIAVTAKLSAQNETDVMTFPVGDAEISVLSEGQQKNSQSILIGATPEMLQKYMPDGSCPAAVNAFLVRKDGKNILIDAGFGRNLHKNIESLKLSAEKIDAILITHMHGDHVGGLLKDGKPAFSNAALYIAQPEYEYWTSGERKNSVAAIIDGYKNRLKLFTPASNPETATETVAGLKAIAAYGHTPGHTAYLLESAESKLLICGDLTHAMAVQAPHPEVAVTYDVDPKKAVEIRKKIFEYVSKNKIPIAGMHTAFPGIGDIKPDRNGGYEFTLFCTCLGY
ncbi:MAG: MBL fold metallo-hydrolase [Prevotellaceae bacterium]|nr:MBL fold metallo-hydrolase [Prevotellaceae bacterium]